MVYPDKYLQIPSWGITIAINTLFVSWGKIRYQSGPGKGCADVAQAMGSKQKDIKMANHRVILAALRRYGMLSRSELSEQLSISAPTISKNVDELLLRRVLIEHGTVATNVGRRPNMLGINPDYCNVAVVDFSHVETTVAVANMKGEIVARASVYSGEAIDRAHIDQVIRTLQDLLEQGGHLRLLKAISIATPGLIDTSTGRFLYAPRFVDYQNINLHSMFAQTFDVEILLKNDISMAALGEALYGAGKGFNNQLYIYLDHGVGTGLVLDGKLYEGSRGTAGEVGTWMVDPREAYAMFRNGQSHQSRVLDSEITGHGIRRKVWARLRAGEESVLSAMLKPEEIPTFSQVVSGFQVKDPLCRAVVEESAVIFTCILKNLIDFLDVDLVIIGGAVRQFGDAYMDVVHSYLDAVHPMVMPKLVWSDLQGEAGLHGAVGNSLEYVFEQIVQQTQNFDGQN